MSTNRSARALRLCALFGIQTRAARPPGWCDRAARDLDAALRPGQIALICGPSGAGKSAIVRSLARYLRSSARPVLATRPPRRLRRLVIDLFSCALPRALSHLARAGLADARVMLTPASSLSEGQKARLAIALAMARARPGATLILDEFASTLDRAAALALARAVRRWIDTEPHVRLVCATAHDDLLEPLAPEVLVDQRLGAPAVLHERNAA